MPATEAKTSWFSRIASSIAGILPSFIWGSSQRPYAEEETKAEITPEENNAVVEEPHTILIESVLSPEEMQFRKRMRNAFIAHSMDALAMFLGTMAWMGVYYARSLYEEIDDADYASYALHCLTMGIVSNLSVLPFIYLSQIFQGETKTDALSTVKKYMILCTIPDALYEPTADFLIAFSSAETSDDFEFVKYANSNFNPREMVGGFFLFGVAFGIIYRIGDKIIEKYSVPNDEDDEEDLTSDAANINRILRAVRDFLESPTVSAVKAALQYFIFYLSDNFFDVDWVDFETTMPDLLGVCAMMAAYSFVMDSLPEVLHIIEHNFYPPRLSRSIEIINELYDENENVSAVQLTVSSINSSQISVGKNRSSLFANAHQNGYGTHHHTPSLNGHTNSHANDADLQPPQPKSFSRRPGASPSV